MMNSKIIAAIKDDSLDALALTSVEWIFDLAPDIAKIKERAELCHKVGKKYFIHFDLAAGIGKDKSGMLFSKGCGVDGIISTRVNVIKMAHELKLFTVQRFFIVDSHSIETTLEGIKTAKPDMIEIMPGTISKVISALSTAQATPIIAGGLIETEEELALALSAGAAAVSTSRVDLWKY